MLGKRSAASAPAATELWQGQIFSAKSDFLAEPLCYLYWTFTARIPQ